MKDGTAILAFVFVVVVLWPLKWLVIGIFLIASIIYLFKQTKRGN